MTFQKELNPYSISKHFYQNNPHHMVASQGSKIKKPRATLTLYHTIPTF